MYLSPGINTDTKERASQRLRTELIELHYSSSCLVMRLGEIGAHSQMKPRTLVELIWLQQLSQVQTQAHLLETATRLLLDTQQIAEVIAGAQ